MKKLLTFILALSLVLAAVLLFNTWSFSSRQLAVPAAEFVDIDEQAAAERLAAAIQLPTLSFQEFENNGAVFEELAALMERRFPLVHQSLSRQKVNQYSLLYRWPGRDASLKPAAFLAHLDVVPAESDSLDRWQYPPFSGAIAEGQIWGRGALDNKSVVFALLEAAELLLAQGFQPQRTLYFAFGHDEEIGGEAGAKKLAAALAEEAGTLSFTLDEGMMLVDESLSPAKKLTAVIGVAEKGYVTLKLTAEVVGGHSSVPTETTAVGELAKAITALESQQMPGRLDGAGAAMFDYLGPEMPFAQRLLFANRWLFEGVIVSFLEGTASSAAVIRTTTAPTLIRGGVKDNVLPTAAAALVNFRLLPGDSADDVLNHARRVINSPTVSVEFLDAQRNTEPSLVSSTESAAFELIAKSIAQTFPGALYSPGTVVGGTDSKHYTEVAENNYRFSPFVLTENNRNQMHGVNERITIDGYADMIRFYVQVFKNLEEVPQ